ncbi:integrase [Novosphingobium sp. KA1]|nr:integrase [Novosphingobium sp. KA1]
MVPACDGVNLSPSQRRELWARFSTAAPRPRTPFEASCSDRKLRSRTSRSDTGSMKRPS